MKSILIIVSGMPATGKTRFSEWLSQELAVPLLSLDDVWEKGGTVDIPFAQYWSLCEDTMKSSSPLIIEFGFDDKIKPKIEGLVEKYKYQTINVHFDTSFEIAHRRFNNRRLYEMGGAKPQISLGQYIEIAEHDKEFRFGERIIFVDTTDFSTILYADIVSLIKQYAMQTL
jgi:hypothetical protein